MLHIVRVVDDGGSDRLPSQANLLVERRDQASRAPAWQRRFQRNRRLLARGQTCQPDRALARERMTRVPGQQLANSLGSEVQAPQLKATEGQLGQPDASLFFVHLSGPKIDLSPPGQPVAWRLQPGSRELFDFTDLVGRPRDSRQARIEGRGLRANETSLRANRSRWQQSFNPSRPRPAFLTSYPIRRAWCRFPVQSAQRPADQRKIGDGPPSSRQPGR